MKTTARFLVWGLLLLGIAGMMVLWRNATQSESVEIQFLGYRAGTNGTALASFVVTNRSLTLIPTFAATQQADRMTPQYIVDRHEQGRWMEAAVPTQYGFRLSVPPLTGWEFELGLGTAESPQRLRLFYGVGEERLGPVGETLRSLWRRIGLQQQIKELRIELPPWDEADAVGTDRNPAPPRKKPPS
jgi:hypothetical protein